MTATAVLCCCTQQEGPSPVFGKGLLTWVELRGIEPLTSSMRTRRATNCATAPCGGTSITGRVIGFVRRGPLSRSHGHEPDVTSRYSPTARRYTGDPGCSSCSNAGSSSSISTTTVLRCRMRECGRGLRSTPGMVRSFIAGRAR